MKRMKLSITVHIAAVTCMIGSVAGDYMTMDPNQFLVFARGDLKIDQEANITGNVGGGGKVTLKSKGVFGSNIFSNGAFTAEQEIQVNRNILSNGSLYMKEKSTVLGEIFVGGTATFDRRGNYRSVTSGSDTIFGEETNMLGNLQANGDVRVDPNSTIDGDVVHGGTFSTGSNVTVTGDVTSGSPNPTSWIPQYRNVPTLNTSESGTTNYDENSDLTLDPGDYGTMNVEKKSTVRLSAGTYNFASLSFGDETELLLDNTNGKIFINVVGDASFDKKVVFDLLNNNSSDLLFKSGGKTHFGDNAILEGNFLSFGNDMSIGKHSTITGSVYSDGKLTLRSDVSIIPAPSALLAIALFVGINRRRRQ